MQVSRFLDAAILGLGAWGVALWALGRHVDRARPAARWAWRASWGSFAAAWVASTPAVAMGLVGALEPPPVDLARIDDAALRARTAIVVLSSSTRSPVPGDTPLERLDPAGAARCVGAARVWRRLQTGYVIATGRAPGDAVDATVLAMADMMVMHGVPRARILLEPWALDTRQNAVNALRVGRRAGVARYVVVTSALHMRRSLREFRRAGVEAVGVPVNHLAPMGPGLSAWLPAAWSFGLTSAALHELLGMLKP